jgi:hypothetical protein
MSTTCALLWSRPSLGGARHGLRRKVYVHFYTQFGRKDRGLELAVLHVHRLQGHEGSVIVSVILETLPDVLGGAEAANQDDRLRPSMLARLGTPIAHVPSLYPLYPPLPARGKTLDE